METLAGSGVRTRSMAKQGHSDASLLAPAKLSLKRGAHAPTGSHTKHTTQETRAAPLVQTRNNENQSDACDSTPLRAQKAVPSDACVLNTNSAFEEVPMDLGGVLSPANHPASGKAVHQTIDSTAVVCCAKCSILYQYAANQQSSCPLCSAKESHRRHYEEDLEGLQAALDANTKQIKDLQDSLQDIKTTVAHLCEQVSRIERDFSHPTEVLGMTSGQLGSLLQKALEYKSVDIAEIITCCETKIGQLCQLRDKFDCLVEEYSKSVEEAGAFVSRGAGLRPDSPYPSTGPGQGRNSKSPSDQPTPAGKAAVLIVGDSNVFRSRDVVKNMLGRDHRVTVLADPGHNISNSVALCTEWLRREGPALVIVHSGLIDILSMENDTKEDIANSIENICSAVRGLFEECGQSNATLSVCSIPEVIDFKKRRDWRQVAFAVNVALKGLSNDLGFGFIDIAAKVSATSYLMAADGFHYNRYGQEHAMSAIAGPVAAWLNIQVASSNEYFTKKKQPFRPRFEASGPLQAKNSAYSGRRPEYSYPQRLNNPASSVSFRPPSSWNMPFSVGHRRDVPGQPDQPPGYAWKWEQRSGGIGGYVSSYKLQHLNPWMPGAVPWS